MSNVTNLADRRTDSCHECGDDLRDDRTHTGNSYFGICPTCRSNDGYINIGKAHWFYCREHRVRWLVGVNLFSTWHGQTEEQQRAEYGALGFDSFRDVEPHYCSVEKVELELLSREAGASPVAAPQAPPF